MLSSVCHLEQVAALMSVRQGRREECFLALGAEPRRVNSSDNVEKVSGAPLGRGRLSSSEGRCGSLVIVQSNIVISLQNRKGQVG